MTTTASTTEHPTTEAIYQSITNRLLDIEREERALESERTVLERARTALDPRNAPKRPGRKPHLRAA